MTIVTQDIQKIRSTTMFVILTRKEYQNLTNENKELFDDNDQLARENNRLRLELDRFTLEGRPKTLKTHQEQEH